MSCKNYYKEKDIKVKVEKYKQIMLPTSTVQNNKSLKIATYINGDCSVCISELSMWKDWIIQDSSKVQFLFFFHSLDTLMLNYVIKRYFNLKYPIIDDKESEYLSKNNINKHDKMFQTFLLDKNDSVILIGNPLLNKKLAELYRKEIEKRTKRQ